MTYQTPDYSRFIQGSISGVADPLLEGLKERRKADVLSKLPRGQDGKIDYNVAMDYLLRSNQPDVAAKLAPIVSAQAQQGGVYGTPIYGQGPQGETLIGTFDKGGQFRRIDTPGFTPTLPVKTVDTGTGTQIIPNRQPFQGGQPAGAQPPPSVQQGQPIGRQPPPGFAPPAETLPESSAPIQPTPVQTVPITPGQRPGFIPKDVQGAKREGVLGTESGEKIANFGKATAARDTTFESLDRLREIAVKLKNSKGLPGITGAQGLVPNFPWSEAATSQADLETIQSQVGFAALQAMRDASKTGGALGSITEGEHKLLQSNIDSLSRRQSAQSFQSRLDSLIKYVDGAKRRVQSAFEQDYGNLPRGGAQGAQNPTSLRQEAAEAIRKGAPRAAVIDRLRSLNIDTSGL